MGAANSVQVPGKEEWNHPGHKILYGKADCILSTSDMQDTAGTLTEYPGVKMEKLNEFMMSTFLGEGALKA